MPAPTLSAAHSAPFVSAAAVTPSDSADLPGGMTRGLYIGGSGNAVLILANDSAAVTFTGLVAGSVLMVRAKRVKSTSTTATSIVALY